MSFIHMALANFPFPSTTFLFLFNEQFEFLCATHTRGCGHNLFDRLIKMHLELLFSFD
jgi:hypothetical protein